jgi:hypothetical protein
MKIFIVCFPHLLYEHSLYFVVVRCFIVGYGLLPWFFGVSCRSLLQFIKMSFLQCQTLPSYGRLYDFCIICTSFHISLTYILSYVYLASLSWRGGRWRRTRLSWSRWRISPTLSESHLGFEFLGLVWRVVPDDVHFFRYKNCFQGPRMSCRLCRYLTIICSIWLCNESVFVTVILRSMAQTQNEIVGDHN